MKQFGFVIAKPRIIDLDKADKTLYYELIKKIPSAKRCLMCGACTAVCTASQHTEFNFRKSHQLFRNGQIDHLAEEMDKCMLCGNCQIACPRGVNTRAVINTIRLLLETVTYEKRKL